MWLRFFRFDLNSGFTFGSSFSESKTVFPFVNFLYIIFSFSKTYKQS